MAPDKAGRVVFVGNIPYGIVEKNIVDTLSRAGQVLSFRLVYDKDTGKPKGFGFAEFSDADAAASAVRNLNDFEIMGRKLRVDYSNDAPAHEGQFYLSSNNTNTDSTVSNYATGVDGSNSGIGGSTLSSNLLPPLPAGADVPPELTATDSISRTLKTLPPQQLLDILVQMKALATGNPNKAIELLKQAPQLSYAIFQSLLLLGLVDTTTLANVLTNTSLSMMNSTIPAGNAPTQALSFNVAPNHTNPPTSQISAPLPTNLGITGYLPIQGGVAPQQAYATGAYGLAAPVGSSDPYSLQSATVNHHPGNILGSVQAPSQQVPQYGVPTSVPSREELIQQVLALTTQQLEELPPADRAQLELLRSQFGTVGYR